LFVPAQMALSSTGKKKLWAYAFIIALDTTVLVLSVLVNIFQEFFFMADLFPLVLSIVTLVILSLQITLDLTSKNAFTARPAFEIPLLGILTIVWLVSNSFSTSRWAGLPNCSVFLGDGRAWCRNLQGLRAIIWVEWAAMLLVTLALTRISVVQARSGNTAVWHMALSRYHPDKRPRDFVQDASSFYRGSSIFGFDKPTGHQNNLSAASRDWFAPAEPAIRLSDNVEGQGNTDTPSSSGGRAGLGAYGTGAQSAVPPQQQFQTPNQTRERGITQTIDGFEIVSGGYYTQKWGGPQYK